MDADGGNVETSECRNKGEGFGAKYKAATGGRGEAKRDAARHPLNGGWDDCSCRGEACFARGGSKHGTHHSSGSGV